MCFKVLMVIVAVSYTCTALPITAEQGSLQNTALPFMIEQGSLQDLDLAQTPGALSDIFTAVIDLLRSIREFQSQRYNKDPSKFVAIFPDFVRRTVEANARLRGRPVTDAEKGAIERLSGLEKVVADSTAQVTRNIVEALELQSDSSFV
ncbi:uncharacterized protein [Palaemon carinicauda]|uniref:uncharacterized protein n=1 Tax=Palaemon carinicauda TaxID=392227 RepID=UPI0035B63AE3